jgi:hypothetical protein
MSLSTTRDPVDTIVALLNNTTAADFTGNKPQIFRYDETTSKGRQNEARPALYVVAFGSTTLTRFGVDPGVDDTQQEQGEVQVICATLQQADAQTLAEDVVGILRGFQADNFDSTNQHAIMPTSIVDNRAQKMARMTNQFIYVVECQTERLAS